MDIGEAVSMILNNPEKFDEVMDARDTSPPDTYEALRDRCKRSLSSFDAYLRFYETMLEYGPTKVVERDLERNAVRSLKNMVRQSSQSGSRFPIDTLAEFQRRVEAYSELGITSVTPRSAAATLLEHLYDDDETSRQARFRLIDSLFREEPAESGQLVTLLALARFASESPQASETEWEKAINRLAVALPDPLPADGRDGDALMSAAEEIPLSDDEHLKTIQAAFVRTSSEIILEELVYYYARDVVERARHQGDEIDRPWRGESQLAKQLLWVHDRWFDTVGKERRQRRESYDSLLYGMLNTQGRWQSLRDPRALPSADFLRGATAWFQAAASIRPVDELRHLKYLSKGFRFLGEAARTSEIGPNYGWTARVWISQYAVRCLTQIASRVNDTERESDRFQTDLNSLVATHTFQRYESEAVIAYYGSNPSQVREHCDKAAEQASRSEIYLHLDRLDGLKSAADALEQEQGADYASAVQSYRQAPHNIVSEERVKLTELKLAVQRGEYGEARDKAVAAFGDESIFTAVTGLLSGRRINTAGFHSLKHHGIVPRSQEAAWKLVTAAQIAKTTPTPHSSAWETEVETALLTV